MERDAQAGAGRPSATTWGPKILWYWDLGIQVAERSDFLERPLYLKKDAQKQFKRSSWLGSEL